MGRRRNATHSMGDIDAKFDSDAVSSSSSSTEDDDDVDDDDDEEEYTAAPRRSGRNASGNSNSSGVRSSRRSARGRDDADDEDDSENGPRRARGGSNSSNSGSRRSSRRHLNDDDEDDDEDDDGGNARGKHDSESDRPARRLRGRQSAAGGGSSSKRGGGLAASSFHARDDHYQLQDDSTSAGEEVMPETIAKSGVFSAPGRGSAGGGPRTNASSSSGGSGAGAGGRGSAADALARGTVDPSALGFANPGVMFASYPPMPPSSASVLAEVTQQVIAAAASAAGPGGAAAAAGKGPLNTDTDAMSAQTGAIAQVGFDSVGGLDSHLKALYEMVVMPLLYPALFSRFGITPPRGVLFTGPPGTGKTLTARALASTCSRLSGRNVSFFIRKGADCLSKWVGEAERQLRLLFEQAREMQPSVIFFDEIDGLAPVRSSRQDQVHSSIVSTLLALMDGLDARGQVIVIGATNRVDAIDPALRRPGRFDRELLFALPAQGPREEILRIHTRAWQPAVAPPLLAELAAKTAGYCGADLKALCTEASLRAVRRCMPQLYSQQALGKGPGGAAAAGGAAAGSATLTRALNAAAQALVVTREDFLAAMQAITPAPQRATPSPAARLAPPLDRALDAVWRRVRAASDALFPRGCLPKSAQASGQPSAGAAAGSAIIDAGSTPAGEGAVFRPRFLLHGAPDHGQAALAAALLHRLDDFPLFSLHLPALLADFTARGPEEAAASAITEARRNAPSVLYWPQIDLWWGSASAALRTVVLMMLSDLPPQSPVYVVGWSECAAAELPNEVAAFFDCATASGAGVGLGSGLWTPRAAATLAQGDGEDESFNSDGDDRNNTAAAAAATAAAKAGSDDDVELVKAESSAGSGAGGVKSEIGAGADAWCAALRQSAVAQAALDVLLAPVTATAAVAKKAKKKADDAAAVSADAASSSSSSSSARAHGDSKDVKTAMTDDASGDGKTKSDRASAAAGADESGEFSGRRVAASIKTQEDEERAEKKRQQQQQDEVLLLHLRMFLRSVAAHLLQNYRDFIEEPRDDVAYRNLLAPIYLKDIQFKVNDARYLSVREFLSDIDLLVANTKQAYSLATPHGRSLVNRACNLQDSALTLCLGLDSQVALACELVAHRLRTQPEGFVPWPSLIFVPNPALMHLQAGAREAEVQRELARRRDEAQALDATASAAAAAIEAAEAAEAADKKSEAEAAKAAASKGALPAPLASEALAGAALQQAVITPALWRRLQDLVARLEGVAHVGALEALHYKVCHRTSVNFTFNAIDFQMTQSICHFDLFSHTNINSCFLTLTFFFCSCWRRRTPP